MTNPIVAGIVDLGSANLANVARALERCGAHTRIVANAGDIAGCGALVLPGVAHVGYICAIMDERGLRDPILRAVARGTPILGICAGYHVLFEGSDEDPDVRGLAIFEGRVTRLKTRRTPHMGWNLVRDRDERAYWAYFAHSFAPAETPHVLAWTTHESYRFASMARRGSVWGVQFHPERSGAYGRDVINAFLRAAGQGR